MSTMPPRRGGGMQVHAVPENERAVDPNTGQRLPWGYEYADPERSTRRVLEERGPFGRSTQRRTTGSRSRTAPGKTAQEKGQTENWKAIDDIFSRAKETQAVGKVATAAATIPLAGSSTIGAPTECILYGFPEVYQYSAIEFYECVSMGLIYEDYDRLPESTKFDQTLSRNARARNRKVPADALKKVNRYHGGEHWIKVTFDSTDAADRACYYSPHTLNGHIIYCERYRGTGPIKDEPIPATAERLASVTASPSQSISSTIQANDQSSTTASSNTVTASQPQPSSHLSPLSQSSSNAAKDASATTGIDRPKTALIRGASRVDLLPAEQALLPTSSIWHQTFGAWPIIGLFFGSAGHTIIGSELPRKEDGSFDWDTASLYWKLWALLDLLWFCNFLGLKDDKSE